MESKKLQLETLTPVRIGSYIGEITPYDYVLAEGNCYVISEEKLARFLGENNLVDDFSRRIAQEAKRFNMGDFLSGHGLEGDAGLRGLSSYVVQVHENARPMRLLPIIRDVERKPYIPGSSIKGAMRTAVIYTMLKKMRESDPDAFNRHLIEPVRRKLDEIRKEARGRKPPEWRRKTFAGDLEKELTTHFDFANLTKKNGSYAHGPHTDIFRCLKVSDALPAKLRYRIYDFRVTDKQSGGELAFESPIFAESLSPGAAFDFWVSWDSWLAKRFEELNEIPLKGLDDVLQACKVFTSDQIKWETSFFQSCRTGGVDARELTASLADMKADLRLGWGSGLTGASLSMLLPLELRIELRDTFYRRHASGTKEFPKSRRVLVNKGTPVSLLGFCRLKEEEGP